MGLSRRSRKSRCSSRTSPTSPRSTRSWRAISGSPIRPVRPWGSRSCRRARAWKSNASSVLIEAGEQRPVTTLRGVGTALAERLARLGIRQVQDLLFLLPTRYEDRTHVTPLGSLTPGAHAVVEGEIQLTEVTYRRRRQLLCRISDGSGFLTLRFFHFTAAQQHALTRGLRLRCYGEVRRGPMGLEIVHPEYRRVDHSPTPLAESLTPMYPATEGLTQPRLRMLIDQALGEPGRVAVRDWLPNEVQRSLHLPALRDALELLHRPPQHLDHTR